MSYADELRWRLELDDALLSRSLPERIDLLVTMDILVAKPRFGSDTSFDKFLGTPSHEYEWTVGTAVLRSSANLAREVTADKLLRSIVRDDAVDALDRAVCARHERIAA